MEMAIYDNYKVRGEVIRLISNPEKVFIRAGEEKIVLEEVLKEGQIIGINKIPKGRIKTWVKIGEMWFPYYEYTIEEGTEKFVIPPREIIYNKPFRVFIKNDSNKDVTIEVYVG